MPDLIARRPGDRRFRADRNPPEVVARLVAEHEWLARVAARRYLCRLSHGTVAHCGGADAFYSEATLALWAVARLWDPGRAAFSTALYCAVRRRFGHMLSYYARRPRTASLSLAVVGGYGEPFERSVPARPDRDLDPEAREDRARAYAALRVLDPRRRRAVELRLAGYKYREIAVALGITKQRVNQLLTQARATLARHARREAAQ